MNKYEMTVDKEKQSAYDRERRDLFKRLGRCAHCGVKLESGYTRVTCPDCLAVKRAKNRAAYISRIAQGVCGLCGGVLEDPTYRTCESCRAKITERNLKKRAV